jgi:ATP-binding cassette subfamily B protein
MAGANMVQEDEILGRAYDSRLMSRLLTYLRPYKKQVALAFVLILGTTFAGLAGPFLLRHAVDDAIAPGKFDLLVTIALVYLGTVVLGFGFR